MKKSSDNIFGVDPKQKIGKLKRYEAQDVAWVEFGDYIIGEGAAKAMKELKNLEGDAYLKHFANLAEFVKPRLTRVDSKVEQQVVINIKTENTLPEAVKRDIIEGETVIEEILPTGVVGEESP